MSVSTRAMFVSIDNVSMHADDVEAGELRLSGPPALTVFKFSHEFDRDRIRWFIEQWKSGVEATQLDSRIVVMEPGVEISFVGPSGQVVGKLA